MADIAYIERIYLGGPIVTVNGEDVVAEALAVAGETIVAVGDEVEIRALAGDGVEIIDLEGKALLPGFIDPHSHFPNSGRYGIEFVDLNSPPIGTMNSIPDIIEALRLEAAGKPEGTWVVGRGYDDTLLQENRHPDRWDLDKVSSRHPIFLSHISGHLGSCNSLALKLGGVTADTENPPGGVIRHHKQTGEPTGVFEEPAAMALVRGKIPPGDLEHEIKVIEAAARDYLSKGVTSAQNAATDKTQMRALQESSARGLLPLRILGFPNWEYALEISAGTAAFDMVADHAIGRGAAKLFQDGSIQGYTGYLSKPYHVPFEGDESYRGYAIFPRERLLEIVTDLHQHGWQVAIHGNGDAAIDDILDAFEAAQEKHPREDARHIIVHSQMAREDQLDRIADLRAIPSFFSLHTYYWGDRHRDIFMGPERAQRISPARSAQDRGLHYTIHCDTPVVPMTPLLLVWAAVNRQTVNGASLGPEQCITPAQALRAVTIEGAYQSFEEELKGSLEPGKLADLVILSGNPLDDAGAIRELRVEETIVGGKTVYLAPSEETAAP
ncbi:MAG: amidohydrolase [Alphaproteobacteria bacterium]|jgi:hypothetical protein|nr:amidohydrolase [Alphaproteobacteria bacterium]MDP6257237.1 amidohydrolase [Alphaproteobacteria bacterium]MDP7056164.1 amidohydrolase [Alphaproteobacteria bacterium]MDP7231083.1 amidohydrolase [Alphaproteobacteria bacterium]MDP7461083.1 amidohydrolase [Alphaproteobacteria bacterium]|tara:strand:- start:1606 stop:3264 length:1659 start_codon:yes stop_codon:yes gene_type:complete